MHTGRKPCEDEGRDCSDEAEARDYQQKPPEPKRVSWTRFSLTDLTRKFPTLPTSVSLISGF